MVKNHGIGYGGWVMSLDSMTHAIYSSILNYVTGVYSTGGAFYASRVTWQTSEQINSYHKPHIQFEKNTFRKDKSRNPLSMIQNTP